MQMTWQQVRINAGFKLTLLHFAVTFLISELQLIKICVAIGRSACGSVAVLVLAFLGLAFNAL